MAKDEGITDDQIAAVQRGEAADGFDSAVITGVDELDEESQLSDQTWAALGERLNDQQRMDFVFTVGCYTLLAMAFNTFGIQLEHADQY
jgi:4-carboxymuconolactone decarboxylase